MLTGTDNDEIEVQISSLGGSIDHAVAIPDLFASHGNVTSILNGMVASAATILALGAKKTWLSRNSMYFIHKAMIGILTNTIRTIESGNNVHYYSFRNFNLVRLVIYILK